MERGQVHMGNTCSEPPVTGQLQAEHDVATRGLRVEAM